MSGYGTHRKRADVLQRKANLAETERLVKTTNLSSEQIAQRLGVSKETVTRYRIELIAEGRIPKFKRGRNGE